MPEVISNTTCLILLDNSDLLYILHKLYGNVYITNEVFEEYGQTIPEWIRIKSVKNTTYTSILSNIMDIGEASTIALSLELDNNLVILDDLKARKTAENMGLKYTGTIGVLLRAKEKGVIASVKDIIAILKSHGFYLSEDIIKKAIDLAGE